MSDQNPKVFVIILNYNGKDALEPCLLSVFQSDYSNLEVVIVDNGSQDESFEKARLLFSRAHFIKNPTNFGFAKGNNFGIRFALEKFADYLFILNNDTIIERSTISELISFAEKNPSCGIACPVIYGPDEKIWFSGGIVDWRKMKTLHLNKIISDKPYSTEYISGCAMLVRKNVYKEIGLFDERFFLYYEDADFSFRAKKAGFDLMIVPSANIKHLEQSNTKNDSKTYWLVLSALLFFHTHSSFWRKIWIAIYVPVRKAKNIYDLIFKKNKPAYEVRRAYKDFKRIC